MPSELAGETALLCTEWRCIEIGLGGGGAFTVLVIRGSYGRRITSSRPPELQRKLKASLGSLARPCLKINIEKRVAYAQWWSSRGPGFCPSPTAKG